MRKLILVVHTSFDGFVSNVKGELTDFIGDDELLNFGNNLTKEADAALFGRINFEGMENYWLTAGDLPNATFEEIRFSNWYKNATRICVSRTKQAVSGNNIIVCNRVPEEIESIKKETGKDIMIYGSVSLAHVLFEHHLIDEIVLLIHPKIFGKGIPLFKEEHPKIDMERKEVTLFSNGVLAIHYVIANRMTNEQSKLDFLHTKQ
jgi:dihydrofolate reductase